MRVSFPFHPCCLTRRKKEFSISVMGLYALKARLICGIVAKYFKCDRHTHSN